MGLSFRDALNIFVFGKKHYIVKNIIDLSVDNPGGVDIDGQGVDYLNIPQNCVIEFQGGKFINGKINLNYAPLLPNGLNISDYFDNVKFANKFHDGQCKWDNSLGCALWYKTNVWLDVNDTVMSNVTSIKGSTDTRTSMSLSSDNKGLRYYDTTLNKYVIWNGSDWVDATGAAI